MIRGWVAGGSRVGRRWVVGGSRVGRGSGWGPDAAAQKQKKTKTSGRYHSPGHHAPREFHDAVRGPPRPHSDYIHIINVYNIFVSLLIIYDAYVNHVGLISE